MTNKTIYPRINYEMTEADFDALCEAAKPTRVMFLSGGVPLGRSPQENATAAWEALGKRMGFDYMTVRPIGGMGERFFSAIPSENETQRAERLARELKEKRAQEIANLRETIAKQQQALDKLLTEAD